MRRLFPLCLRIGGVFVSFLPNATTLPIARQVNLVCTFIVKILKLQVNRIIPLMLVARHRLVMPSGAISLTKGDTPHFVTLEFAELESPLRLSNELLPSLMTRHEC